MASIEPRRLADGGFSFRVAWLENGQRRRATFTDSKDAETFAAKVERNGNRMPAGWSSSAALVAQDVPTLLDRALAHAHPESRDTKAAPEHRLKMRRQFRQHLGDLGALTLDAVTREAVQEWVDDLAADGKAPKTIKNLRSDVSTVFKFATLDPTLPTVLVNPVLGTTIDAEARPPREAVFLARWEFDTIAASLGGEHRVYVELLAATGLRKGEALALRVGDLDLGEHPAVTITKAVKHAHDGVHRIGAPKTRAGRRTVVIDPDTAAMLARHVADRSPADAVFPTHGNDGTWQRVHWVPAIQAAMLPEDRRPRIHDLRHTHASWLLAAGWSLFRVSKRLGHGNISVTADVYGHLDRQDVDPAALGADLRGHRAHLVAVS